MKNLQMKRLENYTSTNRSRSDISDNGLTISINNYLIAL